MTPRRTDQPQGPNPRPRRRSSDEARAAQRGRSQKGSGGAGRSAAGQPSGSGRRSSAARAANSANRVGKRPSADELRSRTGRTRRHPQRSRRRVWPRRIAIFAALVVLAVGITGAAAYVSVSRGLPDPDIRKARGRDQSTIITDRDGKVLARLFAEQNRQDVPLDEIPEHVRQAVIATEDQRYYSHEGVDPLGIARALVVDIIRGEKAQGGSTITQQYVKQAFVSSDKTIKRKVQEAILARRVEQRYSKDEILELYLNTIYFGHGAYGVEAASRAYFNKSVRKVSVAQAAVLAGVIKSPGRYSPYLDEDAALTRRNVVLYQMRDQGYLDQSEYAEARSKKLKVSGLKPSASSAPYFLEWIKAQLTDKYGRQDVYRGGLRVKTTLDSKAQKAAEQAVARVLDKKGDPSAAVVALKPSTGEVIAMVGGSDFSTQQYNVAVQGRRQPGSAFKPFVLAAALTEGVSPEKTFFSGPKTFTVNGQPWKVTGLSTRKQMRLRVATEKSINSVYAQLILDVGPERALETAQAMGIRKGIAPVPAIALGGLEDGVSPLEMARAYGTLAAGGKRSNPFGIARVTDADGDVLQSTKGKLTDAIDPAVAYLTTDILTGVITHGTGTAAAIGRPAAGKTGTTQQYRDAWFVGYTPDLVTAVWVGYPDAQREMKAVHGIPVTGGSFPARIWAEFMRSALAETPKTAFARPQGLKTAKLCTETGQEATEYCPETFRGLLLANMKPEKCEVHAEPTEIVVPRLVGLQKVAALAELEKLELEVEILDSEGDGERGAVLSQEPKPGEKVEPGSIVEITIGAGGGSGEKPKAVIDAPAEVAVGKKATFDASESSDDGEITTYYWEFGDGSTSTKRKATHAFSAPGRYDITLWVTDDSGLQASVSKTIRVR